MFIILEIQSTKISPDISEQHLVEKAQFRPECRVQRYEILGTSAEYKGTRKIGIPLGMQRSVEKAQFPVLHSVRNATDALKIGTHSYGMRASRMNTFFY